MIIYGINSVTEALQSRASQIERIYISRGKSGSRLQSIIDKARCRGIPVRFEPAAALQRRAESNQTQDVVAELSSVKYQALEQVLLERPPIFLLLDSVEDPRNLGAVLRTAEAAGIEHILLPDRHTCGVTPLVVRASAGAALHLRLCRIGNVARTLQLLKESGYWVVGLDMKGEEQAQFDPSLPLVIVVGGEHQGLRRLVRENCDFLVRLPMKGKVSSLNLSVAAGILIYRLLER